MIMTKKKKDEQNGRPLESEPLVRRHRCDVIIERHGASKRGVSRNLEIRVSEVRERGYFDPTKNITIEDILLLQRKLFPMVPIADFITRPKGSVSKQIAVRCLLVRLMKTVRAIKRSIEEDGAEGVDNAIADAENLEKLLFELNPELVAELSALKRDLDDDEEQEDFEAPYSVEDFDAQLEEEGMDDAFDDDF